MTNHAQIVLLFGFAWHGANKPAYTPVAALTNMV